MAVSTVRTRIVRPLHPLQFLADLTESWRFVLPIFLHVGVIHLLFNMAAQVTIGAQIEREMGTIPFLMTYMAGGIYGFVLGGSFNRPGIPSVGASGALFAIVSRLDGRLAPELTDRTLVSALIWAYIGSMSQGRN